MKKVTFGWCVACAVLMVCPVKPASASGKKKATPEPTRPFISAVNGDSITVTTGQVAKTLTLKSNSEVLLNGQRAAAVDLKVGMPVNSIGVGTDPAVVSRLSVADAPPAETGGRKKK